MTHVPGWPVPCFVLSPSLCSSPPAHLFRLGAPSSAEGFYSGAFLIVVSVAFLSIGLRGIVSSVNYQIASWLLAVFNFALVTLGILLVWDALLQWASH